MEDQNNHSLEGVDIIALQDTVEDRSLDFVPQSFDDYLGQDELKKKLSLYAHAAHLRQEPLDHLLLFGPPGVGKTTLAQIMATVMQSQIRICSGPMLERTGDLVAILSNLSPREILFIDEIHRMPTNVEEMLYNAMEHFRVDVILGQGVSAKSINLPIAPFTLVGATTKSGMISAPLRSRFGIIERIDFYTDQALGDIILQNARFLNVSLSTQAALLVGSCARGTPRIAKKLLRRIRDVAQVQTPSSDTQKPLAISDQTVHQALSFLGIDTDGLSILDNTLLRAVLEHFNGGPVGLETLASFIGEDRETVEVVYEPFLLRKGYLERSPRGRQIPPKALLYLKKKFFGQHSVMS